MALDPSVLGGKVRLFPADEAVLGSSETRQDFPCKVTPLAAELDFDLRFHAGYSIHIALAALTGEGNRLRSLARVTPIEDPHSSTYLADQYPVPPIQPDVRGEVLLHGGFTVGEGRYRVDLLLRDQGGRVCSAHWAFAARRRESERLLQPLLRPNSVAAESRDLFGEEPPVKRADSHSAKVLLNFSPQLPGAANMPPLEARALLSILRTIGREPRLDRFSLVVFHLDGRRVLFRQRNVARIDFPQLGKALANLKLGVVDYRRLQEKDGESRFLASLLEEEFHDAIFLVGPKSGLERGSSVQNQRSRSTPFSPLFYLNYNPDPRLHPWPDAISPLVKAMGGRIYPISRPGDLGQAWRDIQTRLHCGGGCFRPALEFSMGRAVLPSAGFGSPRLEGRVIRCWRNRRRRAGGGCGWGGGACATPWLRSGGCARG